jgi:hypothetical protein
MASTYFTRTPASGGNRRTFTFSTWIKRSDISARFQLLFCANNFSGSNLNSQIFFNQSNQLATTVTNNGTNVSYLLSTQLFRDVSAWYHIVIAYDTTQATDTNRVKMYVNGSQITALDTATYPTQNLDTAYNQISIPQVIGYRHSEAADYYTDGLLANTILIDGQQLTPSSFGQTDATTGIWKPKSYTGSYGTNGFFLKFESSGSLGTDSSGNGNNFTVSGTPTQTLDTPSNVFATWNPLAVYDTGRINTLTNGNTSTTDTAGVNYNTSYGTLSVSKGKWYWEIKPTSLSVTCALGVYFGLYTGGSYPFDTNVFGCHQNGLIYYNGSTYSYMASYTSNDIVTFALDMDNGKFYMGKNGSWANGSGSTNQTFANAVSITDDIPASFPTGKDVFPIATVHTATANINFGNGVFGTTAISSPYSDGAGLGKFQYSVPTGYYALCTKNINVYG